MNETAENMFKQIGIEKQELKNWENLKQYEKNGGQQVIEKGEPIFMRLNVEEEIEYIKQSMK